MDSEDEQWLNRQVKHLKMDVSSLKFESMMDRLEKGSGQMVCISGVFLQHMYEYIYEYVWIYCWMMFECWVLVMLHASGDLFFDFSCSVVLIYLLKRSCQSSGWSDTKQLHKTVKTVAVLYKGQLLSWYSGPRHPHPKLHHSFSLRDEVPSISWIRSFITGRMHESNTQHTLYGLLWCPIGQCTVPASWCSCDRHMAWCRCSTAHSYADDAQLYIHKSPDNNNATFVHLMSCSCINEIGHWMYSNRLTLN